MTIAAFGLAAALLGCGLRAASSGAPPPRPIAQGLTLRYWTPRWIGTSEDAEAPDLVLYDTIEKVTGIHVDFAYPTSAYPQGQLEQLRASQEMPDIIEWDWPRSYPGGPARAVDDGIIASIGELIPKRAPNLYRLLQNHPEISRAITTADGRYYAFPDLRTDAATRATVGPLIRKDWLGKVGAQVPETLEQWHELLRTFKHTSFGSLSAASEYPFFILTYRSGWSDLSWMEPISDELVAPFFFASNAFAGAYGLSHGFARRNGSIEYDPARPEYRQVVELLAGWFAEGLIHPSVLDPGALRFWTDIIPSCGAWIGSVGMTSFLRPLTYVPAPLPLGPSAGAFVGPALAPPYTGVRCAAVSAASAHLAEAVAWLDVGYGDWGKRLLNFGTQGATYELRSGAPVLKEDVVTELQHGRYAEKPAATGFYRYARGILGGPFDLDPELYRQYIEASMPGAGSTVMGWHRGSYDDPLSLVGGDSAGPEQLSAVLGAIREHTYQSVLAFVSGRRPLSEFDRFREELDKLGLQRALETLRKEDAALKARRPVLQ
jgi:putative aldouronate transport system substrate-binding protein